MDAVAWCADDVGVVAMVVVMVPVASRTGQPCKGPEKERVVAVGFVTGCVVWAS